MELLCHQGHQAALGEFQHHLDHMVLKHLVILRWQDLLHWVLYLQGHHLVDFRRFHLKVLEDLHLMDLFRNHLQLVTQMAPHLVLPLIEIAQLSNQIIQKIIKLDTVLGIKY